MKAKDGLIIIAAAFVLGLSYPHLQEWLTPSHGTPNTAPRLTLPKEGVPADAFTHRLLQAALNAQPEGNILLAPNSLAAILLQMKPLASEELAACLDSLNLPGSLQESAANAHEAACLFADSAGIPNASANNLGVLPVPFSENLPQALARINTTIASFTAGHISQVTDSEQTPPQTGIASVNALSFDTPWLYPASAKGMGAADFYNANGGVQRVRMLPCKGSFRIAEDPQGQWKAVALFFRNNSPANQPLESCCLVAILPQSGHVRQLARDLTPDRIAAIRTALAQAPETDGTVEMPRLMFPPLTQDITPILRLLGIGPLFTTAAPLSHLAEGTPLPYTCALQSCSINLSETEAIPGITPPMPDIAPLLMQLNRPFLWFIGSLTSPAPPYALGIIEAL